MPAFRDALILHALLAGGAFALLHFLHPPLLGWAALGLVVAYNLLLPLIARRGGHGDWLDLWAFLLPLSMLLMLPAWVMSRQFGALAFAEIGAPRIAGLPLYLAGIWVIPLFWVLWLAGRSLLAAAFAALLILAASEYAAPLLHLWHPEHVRTHFGVADYIVPPGALLGAAAVYAWRETRGAGPLPRLGAVALVAILHTGALVLAYLLAERLRF